ncbi:hypothetical protein PQR67_25190 [Paraburkholderia fungorum]|uniref:hypothetical protein n=1 Tax=Paraburkholderia fungorum TaxID=134537 RepID=UPI0038B8FF7D
MELHFRYLSFGMASTALFKGARPAVSIGKGSANSNKHIASRLLLADVSFAGYRTHALLTQRFLRIGAPRYPVMLFASMRGKRRETLQLEALATVSSFHRHEENGTSV